MPLFLFSVLSTLQVCAVRKCRGKARYPVRLEELVHAAGGDSCVHTLVRAGLTVVQLN